VSVSGAGVERTGGRNLIPRILTAAFLIPLTLASIFLGGRIYAGVIAAMTIFLVFEWTRMVDGAEFSRGFYVLSATAALAAYFAAGGMPLVALSAVVLGGIVATLLEWPKDNPQSWAMVGALYIIVPAVAALWLRRDAQGGEYLTFLLFACVWAADSAAFLVGNLVGGPKLAPRISPQKTWSGAVGAVIGSALAAEGVARLAPGETIPGFGLGIVLGVACILGDLIESLAKRRYGMKDTGGAFPGHGGVLDRLDGFLFAVLALSVVVLFGQHARYG
jgi:phosphatidate cytidylyltransferase